MHKMVFVFAVVIVVCSGCETLSGRQRRQSEMRLQSDIVNLKASVHRLEARVEGIEASREDIYAQFADLRSTLDRTGEQRGVALQSLESKLAAQTAAQEKMRKEMVDELSGKIVGIMRTQVAPPGAVRTESGYEHVVKAGETLSEIAKAYGTKIDVIIKANKLKNPDDLRLGQKLFIPE